MSPNPIPKLLCLPILERWPTPCFLSSAWLHPWTKRFYFSTETGTYRKTK